MSININIHPEEFRVTFYPGAGAFTAIDFTGATDRAALLLHNEAQCNELIAAATEAKRLLAEATMPEQLYVVVEHSDPLVGGGGLIVVTDPKPRAEAKRFAREEAESFAGPLEVRPATQADLDDADDADGEA